MPEIDDPQQNHILRALSPAEFEEISPHLVSVTKASGETLYQGNDKLEYVFFPTTCVASLLCELEDGTSVEVAAVGREGVVGVSVFMGGSAALTQATIHTAGNGYRLSGKTLQSLLTRSGGRREGKLQKLLMCYSQALLIQMAQTTACNQRHSIDQQFSRWLLVNIDRVETNRLHMTHELISNMLGVRRESVTGAAIKLHRAGFIRYRRGLIEVTNRAGLEAHVCECYGIMKKVSDQLVKDFLGPF